MGLWPDEGEKMMKKILALALCAVLVVGALSGCGKKGTLQKIKDAGEMVMMTNATFPPYEYVKDGVVMGVDQELAQMIADEIGVKLTILDMNFDLLIPSLKGGKGDIVAAGMSITDERKEEVDFSIPYVDATLLIMVPKGSSIAGPDDLVGKTISVQENTTSDIFVTDNIETKEVLRFKSAVDAGSAVVNGQSDVAVIDEMTAKSILANNQDTLSLLEEPLGQEQYAMAVPKGDAEFLAIVDKVLGDAVADGTVDALIAKHMEASKAG